MARKHCTTGRRLPFVILGAGINAVVARDDGVSHENWLRQLLIIYMLLSKV
jgi:hypothetical protein